MRLNRNKYRQWPESKENLKKYLKDIEETIEFYKSKRRSENIKNLLESLITKEHEIKGKLLIMDMEREREKKEIERRKRKERKLLRELKKKQEEEQKNIEAYKE